ncbi:MAG: DUF1592 domain-containing protein, partial [Lentisphaeraceae bacterium]|nr:DUF1592 domain-containing protein [Lentisphaeraceae bacterium]
MYKNLIVFLAFFMVASTSFADTYKDKVLPFLESYCTRCHDEDKTKAGFRVDTLHKDILGGKDLSRWEHVVDRLYLGDMPPEDTKKQPSNKLRIEVTEWITSQLTQAHAKKNSTGGQVVYRRLNKNEYDNTIRDLFGLYDFSFAKENFPEDEASHGFDNIGKTLTMSPLLMDRVLAGADEALKIGLSGFINKRHKYEEKVIDPLAKMWKGEERKKTQYRMVDGKLALVSNSGIRVPVRWAGFYTLRLSLRAMGESKVDPLIEVLAGKLGNGNPPRLRPGHFSLAPGKTSTIEVTTELRDREEFKFEYVNHGNTRSSSGGGKKPTIPNPKFNLANSRALVIEKIELLGPFREWPVRQSPAVTEGYSKNALEDFLIDFAAKAFRRSVTKTELLNVLTMAKAAAKSGGHKEGVRVGLKAILCSPHFLYINESPGRLDDYALASRLSYFLWSSMPDAELFNLAAQGKLKSTKVREAQIRRMLKDPKAKSFSQNFVGQWLELRTLGDTTPDDILYPEYDNRLEESMNKETFTFFNEVLHDSKLTIHDFIDADFSMVNDRLAKHYGMSPVSGFALRRVKLKPSS